MDNGFKVGIGADNKIPNHVVIWDFEGVSRKDAGKPVIAVMNRFLPRLQALTVKDAPQSEKVKQLADSIRAAALKKLPKSVAPEQLQVRIGYADTPAVEQQMRSTFY